eukprot:TRINITY_DN36301_c0_g1_i1.p1 TRINITY_DN36301_c0_g1~~TRINITY_DN36301_c0_g1_i1.p1  ORF type:complete len:655 (+),score=112.87 TRINITY_DN36301_c0_g1_i1:63-2027(+)
MRIYCDGFNCKLPCLNIVLWLQVAQASLLSSSKVQACLNDGSEAMQCDKKVVLAITLEHGQEETEQAEFMIRDVQDDADAGSKVPLQKPWKVSWSKSPAYWRYPLRYRQDVNAKPTELIIQKRWGGCRDNPTRPATELTCQVATVQGVRVADSEGFCCGCDIADSLNGLPTRGDISCPSDAETAHCLGFSDLYYSLFEVDRPQVFYDITITLTKPVNPEQSWANVSYSETTLTLSHQQPTAQAENGAMQLELVGDLATATAPHRFDSKYLAVPSYPSTHPRVDFANPLRDALLVDKSHVDLDGLTCNKVGVSYTAFKRQSEKCESRAQTCLANQLDDFHEEDVERESLNQMPWYLVRGFCEGGVEWGQAAGSGDRFLACTMKQRHTTLLRLEVTAEDAMFVKNVASGNIVRVNVPPFEALSGGGEVNVSVVSTGKVVAQFTVGVDNCSSQFQPGPAVSVSLGPYETSQHTIKLHGSSTKGGRFSCTTFLHNSIGAVVDSQLVHFDVSEMEVDRGTQVFVNQSGEVGKSLSFAVRPTCAVMCPTMTDAKCLVANGCWSRLSMIVLGGLAVVVGTMLVLWATMQGYTFKCLQLLFSPMACLKWCLSGSSTSAAQPQQIHINVQAPPQQMPMPQMQPGAMPGPMPGAAPYYGQRPYV